MPKWRARPTVRKAIPALADLGGRDRRSAGAQPRHHRRLGRQQRSGGGLSRRRARARRHHPHQQARDQGRRLLQGHVRDRACRWRDHHRHPFPEAGQGGLLQVPEPGLALRHRRRVRGQGRQRRARGGDGRRPVRVPLQGTGERAQRQLHAGRGEGGEVKAQMASTAICTRRRPIARIWSPSWRRARSRRLRRITENFLRN